MNAIFRLVNIEACEVTIKIILYIFYSIKLKLFNLVLSV